MKRIYEAQVDKYHNIVEYGDKVSIVVDDETAKRIIEEDALYNAKMQKQAEEESINYSAEGSLIQGLNAPDEWHQANFILAKDRANAKIISTRTLEENEEGEMEEIRREAGVRGAVASGKRQEDGSIIWDWNIDEDGDEVFNKNLLDFHVIPDYKDLKLPEGDLQVQHMEVMPTDEKTNPLMRWKNEKM